MTDPKVCTNESPRWDFWQWDEETTDEGSSKEFDPSKDVVHFLGGCCVDEGEAQAGYDLYYVEGV